MSGLAKLLGFEVDMVEQDLVEVTPLRRARIALVGLSKPNALLCCNEPYKALIRERDRLDLHSSSLPLGT